MPTETATDCFDCDAYGDDRDYDDCDDDDTNSSGGDDSDVYDDNDCAPVM